MSIERWTQPLRPADFVVAGVPEPSPDSVVPDTAVVRRVLGAPLRVSRHEFMEGDTITVWEYDGMEVTFGSLVRTGITLTSPRVPTTRGLRVGDSETRLRQLYGEPQEHEDDDWVYLDPREPLNIIQVTVKAGKVTQIFIGSCWD